MDRPDLAIAIAISIVSMPMARSGRAMTNNGPRVIVADDCYRSTLDDGLAASFRRHAPPETVWRPRDIFKTVARPRPVARPSAMRSREGQPLKSARTIIRVFGSENRKNYR